MQTQDQPFPKHSGIKARPVRIVGQGLVGSLLAIQLHRLGIEFVVHGAPMPGESTPIAPGIVNPLAGRKLRPPDELESLLSALHRAFHAVSETIGTNIWHPMPILRLFSDSDQRDRFHAEAHRDDRSTYVSAFTIEDSLRHVHDPYGGFITGHGGWADLPLLKAASESWLKRIGCFIEQPFDLNSTPDPDESVVFCEGWRVLHNPHWQFIPHNPAKGEMLIVRFTDIMPRDQILNRSCWAQPIEGDLWRIGATYSWSAFDGNPSERAARDLQERLTELTPVPYTVLDQVAGVRPIVEDYHPVVGPHPQIPSWYILNALGSKGILQAPLAVEWLLGALLYGESLPKKWSVQRFIS